MFETRKPKIRSEISPFFYVNSFQKLALLTLVSRLTQRPIVKSPGDVYDTLYGETLSKSVRGPSRKFSR